jgi:hypothetical protein
METSSACRPLSSTLLILSTQSTSVVLLSRQTRNNIQPALSSGTKEPFGTSAFTINSWNDPRNNFDGFAVYAVEKNKISHAFDISHTDPQALTDTAVTMYPANSEIWQPSPQRSCCK